MEINKQLALKVIAGISLVGVIFSGVLSYFEIFQQVCGLGGMCSTTIFTLPSCVYGLVMYLIVFVISLVGLRSKK